MRPLRVLPLLLLAGLCAATVPVYLDLSAGPTASVPEDRRLAVLLYKLSLGDGMNWKFHFTADSTVCAGGMHRIHVTFSDADPRETTRTEDCGTNAEYWPETGQYVLYPFFPDQSYSYTWEYGPFTTLPTSNKCGCVFPECAKAALIFVYADSWRQCAFNVNVTASPICQNGGIFHPVYASTKISSSSCICPQGWEGTLCDKPASSVPIPAITLALDRTNEITVEPGQAARALLALPANGLVFTQNLTQIGGDCTGLKAVYHPTCKPTNSAFAYCPGRAPSPVDIDDATDLGETIWRSWGSPTFPQSFVGKAYGFGLLEPKEGEPGFQPFLLRDWDYKDCCSGWGSSGALPTLDWVRWSLLLVNTDPSSTCKLAVRPTITESKCTPKCVNGRCGVLSPDMSTFEKAAKNDSTTRLDDLVACQCSGGWGGSTCEVRLEGPIELIRGKTSNTEIINGEQRRMVLAVSPTNSKVVLNLRWTTDAEIYNRSVTEHVFLFRLNAPATPHVIVGSAWFYAPDHVGGPTNVPVSDVRIIGVESDALTGTEDEDGRVIGRPFLVRIPATYLPVEVHLVGKGSIAAPTSAQGYDYGVSGNRMVVNVHFDLEENSLLHIGLLDGGLYKTVGYTYPHPTHPVTVSVDIDDSVGRTIGVIAILFLVLVAAGMAFYVFKRVRAHQSGDKDDGIEMSNLGVTVKGYVDRMADSSGTSTDSCSCCGCLADATSGGKKVLKYFLIVFAVLAVIFLIILIALITVMFNMSLLHSSLSSLVSLAAVEDFSENVKEALDFIALPFMADVFRGFRKFFGWLDFVSSIGLDWNCGGALSMMAPVAYVIGAFILAVLVGGDLILVSMTFKSRAKQSKGIPAKILEKVSSGVSTVVLMALQSAIVSLAQLTGSVWGVERNCSGFDKAIVDVGRTMCIVVIIAFLYFAVRLFANVKGWNPKEWLKGVVRIVAMSVGLWTENTAEHFEVTSKSGTYDSEDQETLTLIAKTRGLMWMPLPFGVVLTKFCEAANNPPLFVSGLEMKDGPMKRAGLWLLSVAKFAVTMIPVFSATVQNVVLACVVSIAADLIAALVDVFPMLEGKIPFPSS